MGKLREIMGKLRKITVGKLRLEITGYYAQKTCFFPWIMGKLR